MVMDKLQVSCRLSLEYKSSSKEKSGLQINCQCDKHLVLSTHFHIRPTAIVMEKCYCVRISELYCLRCLKHMQTSGFSATSNGYDPSTSHTSLRNSITPSTSASGTHARHRFTSPTLSATYIVPRFTSEAPSFALSA
jgi:hypothetical protein